MSKTKVAILGSTGIVGQRLVQMIQDSKEFEINALAGSDRNAGKRYGEACKWLLSSGIPDQVSAMEIIPVSNREKVLQDVDLVFSCLPSDAGDIESKYSERVPVISKSSAHRLDKNVPLMIPGINDDHLSLIDEQRRSGKEGFIACDPNCSSTQLSIILRALEDFGVEEVFVDSLQAISGAGYPGTSAIEITGNIIPYIQDEERKMASEPKKILGTYGNGTIRSKNLMLHAKCSRVDVLDGHTQNLFIRLKEKFDVGDIEAALRTFRQSEAAKSCPTSPEKYIVVTGETDRPQPRLDIMVNNGMSVVAGRIEKDQNYCKMTTVSHNTILGAAGGAVLHGELLKLKGYV